MIGVADQEAYDRAMDEFESQRLIRLGFDPCIPVYEVEAIDFDIEDVTRALVDSDYSKPPSCSSSSPTLTWQRPMEAPKHQWRSSWSRRRMSRTRPPSTVSGSEPLHYGRPQRPHS